MGAGSQRYWGQWNCWSTARFGSEHTFIEPEPACGISVGIAKNAVREWTNNDHKKYWESLTGLKHAKEFLQGSSVRRTRQLLKPNRNQLWWVRGLLTGCCHLKGHLFKLGLTNNLKYERCLEKDISLTYPMWCGAYSRFHHLRHYFMEPGDYQDSPLSKTLHFVRSAGMLRGWNRGGCTIDHWW
jgi:hypothetical protein